MIYTGLLEAATAFDRSHHLQFPHLDVNHHLYEFGPRTTGQGNRLLWIRRTPTGISPPPLESPGIMAGTTKCWPVQRLDLLAPSGFSWRLLLCPTTLPHPTSHSTHNPHPSPPTPLFFLIRFLPLQPWPSSKWVSHYWFTSLPLGSDPLDRSIPDDARNLPLFCYGARTRILSPL